MKKSSHVNGLVDVMAHNRSLTLRERWIRTLVQNRLLAFLQLAAIRCTALKFETWILDHPEIELPEDLEEEDLRWENAGFDYDLPTIIREHQSRAKLRSPVASYEPNLRISRVRSMGHETNQLLQRRQSLLPSPRHLPSTDDLPSPSKALLAAPVIMGPRRDPTPEFPSKLRAMVQAQGDERLTKMHGDFEKFRITGKQPDRQNAEERPGTKRYHASESSDYRSYSMSPTAARTQAGTGPAVFGPPGLDQPPAKRLRSTELFPDRYIAGDTTPASDAFQTKATRDSVGESTDVPIRDSAGEGTSISIRDFAYSKDNTATSHESSDQANPSVQSGPSSVPSSRRSAARSDSSLSSVSSTESSRARKALALTLSEDKRRVELNSGKSTASVGMSSNSASLFRSFMNAMSPSGNKSSAEDETRKLNKSPTRRESRARRASGSESSLDGTSEGGGLVRSSSKRSRTYTVPASSSKRQQKQRQTNDETAPLALLSKIGILPEPSELESDETPTASSPRGDTTEDGEESHGNPASTSVDPAESESRKSRV
ncbi:hypothetical protein MBLNU13_g03508t1 [Cladosporium sp. NU13]